MRKTMEYVRVDPEEIIQKLKEILAILQKRNNESKKKLQTPCLD